MAIRKRGDSWQIDYVEPTGRRVRQSFKKRKDAEAEWGKRVSLIAEKRYLDIKKDYKNTLGQLIQKYTENFQHQKSFISAKRCYLPVFKEYFGEDTLLANIKYVDIATYQNNLRSKITKHNQVRKVSSINREMQCLGNLFRKATEWEMIEKSPFDCGTKLRLKENNARKRFLTDEEIARLLTELKPKKHIHRIVFCALNTGMRRGEILNLKWEQVRNGFIYITESKMDEPREIPINNDLAAMFKEIRREQELTSPFVFTYAGHRISKVNNSFHSAMKRAEIQNFRFHDLRHTFASHLIMKGASLKEVQELLGHKDIKMTMRYAHLAQEHKRNAVNLLNGLGILCQNEYVTNTSQIQNTQPKPLLSLAKI